MGSSPVAVNYQNQPKFFREIIWGGDEAYGIGTYWITLYVNGENVTSFDSIGIEYIPKEI